MSDAAGRGSSVPGGHSRPRVLCIADSDSYVKWGAALAGQLPKDWRVRLVIARGNALPSPRQLDEALDGSRFAVEDVDILGREALGAELVRFAPDAVIASLRGLAVQALVEDFVPNVPDRPVIVSGLPGIAVPVLPHGLAYRRSADMLVVHSHREVADFGAVAARTGFRHDVRLTSLPYLTPSEPPGDDAMHATPAPVERDRIVFAAQAIVPGPRSQRAWLLERLVATARAHPDLTVVVKIRAQAGEMQKHDEAISYAELLEEMRSAGVRPPPNLVVESGPMSHHVARAVGLVSVSSTAMLEAIADGVPCLALTDFGVAPDLINPVFLGSGLLGDSDDLVAARFHTPDPAWLEANYFHHAADNTWLPRLQELMELRASSGLPPARRMRRTPVNRAKLIFYRHLGFRPDRHGIAHRTEESFLRVALWANRHRWRLVHLVRGVQR